MVAQFFGRPLGLAERNHGGVNLEDQLQGILTFWEASVIARAARRLAATAVRKRGGALMAVECQPAYPNGALACGEREFPGQCRTMA
jgi:hypothetical protein